MPYGYEDDYGNDEQYGGGGYPGRVTEVIFGIIVSSFLMPFIGVGVLCFSCFPLIFLAAMFSGMGIEGPENLLFAILKMLGAS